MKELHSFTVLRKTTEDVTQETSEGKLTKKVEVEKPVKILLKKPNRSEAEEADMVHAREYGKCLREGLVTNAIVEKLYDKEGFLEDQRSKTAKNALKLQQLQTEYQGLKVQEQKSEDDQKRLQEIEQQWLEIQVDLQNVQDTTNSIFNNTAETKARNKTITWLTLYLTYLVDENENEKPFFRGDSFEQKIKHFDALAEIDDVFTNEVIDKATLYISLWYMGKASSKEDFAEFDKSIKNLTDQEAKEDEKEEVGNEGKLEEQVVTEEGKTNTQVQPDTG